MRRLTLITALLLVVSTAQADDARDHDRAREALEAGEVMPLPRILDRVERDYPGRVLEVELERDDGRWIYELTVLPPSGRVFELKLDAATGALVQSRGPVQERR